MLRVRGGRIRMANQEEEMTGGFTTGQARIDRVLEAVETLFAASFPGRVRALYLIGSHAQGTSIATSDVDLEAIFAGDWEDARERERAQTLARACAALAEIELDIEVSAEARIAAEGVSPVLKLGGVLLAGEDVVAALPLVPLPVWTRDRMHTSYWRLVALFGRPLPVTLPLQYPAADDEFFGYLTREVRLSSGAAVPSTRDLIRAVLWAAAALLALEAGVYVGRKSEVPRLYAEHIGGEFAPYLGELLRACRDDWAYTIPAAPEERARLRALCERTLAFERAFLDRYRAYLLGELASGDATVHLVALRPLHLAPLVDDAVVDAVRRLAAGETTANLAVTRAAREALAACGAAMNPRG